MKKYIQFFCILLLCLALAGCGQKTEKITSSEYYVYYLNHSRTKLESVGYNPEQKNGDALIREYLDALSKPTGEAYHSAIPENVKVNGFVLTDGIVTVDFSDSYYNLDGQSEVLLRAAVVMTISQVPAVEYVAFTVKDKPCMVGGEMLGAMTASDFVMDLGNDVNEVASEDFKLYFANEDGTKLKEYVLTDAKYGDKSKEKFVIEQLIAGPQKEGYTATISSNVKLINIVTSNNICYVDFEESFNTELSEVSDELTIYSIVNSLSELTDVHKVQISIHGDSSILYHGNIPLEEPFVRNLDLVESK